MTHHTPWYLDPAWLGVIVPLAVTLLGVLWHKQAIREWARGHLPMTRATCMRQVRRLVVKQASSTDIYVGTAHNRLDKLEVRVEALESECK